MMRRYEGGPRRHYDEVEARNRRLRRSDRIRRFAGAVFAGFVTVLLMTIFGSMILGLVYG